MANYEQQPTYNPENKAKFTENKPEQFVIDHGAPVNWEKSYLCACRSETGQPDPNCTFCGGTGIAFMEGKNTQLMLQSMDRSTGNTDIGLTMPGTAIGTTLQEDFMSFRDRISFDDQDIPVSILVRVKAHDVTHGVNLRYDVKSVDFVQVNRGNRQMEIVKPETMNVDLANNRFFPTEDMIGSVVSFNLTVALRFYVIDILREGRYQYDNDARLNKVNRKLQKLPRKLLLRREDMYIPDVINDTESDGKVTSVALEPKRQVNDMSLNGFF